MARFYIPPSAIRHPAFTLSGSEAHHAIHVLRLKSGDELDLFDGKDLSFRGRVDSVGAGEVHGTILENLPSKSLPVQLTLFQALTRGAKWEWLLEKACEVGVGQVVPVFTQRSLIKLDAGQAQEKVKRWNRIALSASKQSGRSDLMTVAEPVKLPAALGQLDKKAISLIPWEKEPEKTIHHAMNAECGTRNKDVINKDNLIPHSACRIPHVVNIFIGPEGGWDGQEIDAARRHGVIPVRLGPTLLRTETAGLIAATLVLREFEIY
jgi:16S rRNA (uracil1498-N3)-methyltransferase